MNPAGLLALAGGDTAEARTDLVGDVATAARGRDLAGSLSLAVEGAEDGALRAPKTAR